MNSGAQAASVGTEMVLAPSGPYKPPQTLASNEDPSHDQRGYSAGLTAVIRKALVERSAAGLTSFRPSIEYGVIDTEDRLLDARSEVRTFFARERETPELGISTLSTQDLRTEGKSRPLSETARIGATRDRGIEALQAEIRALQDLLPEGESRPSSKAIAKAFSIASVWPEGLDVPVVGADEGCILFDVFEPSGLVVAEVEVDRSGTQAVWAVVSPAQKVATGTFDLTLPAAAHLLVKTLNQKFSESRRD